MELVFPAMEHKKAAWDYRQEHIDMGESHIHGSRGLIRAEDYERWLESVVLAQTVVPDDSVTGAVYFAIVDKKIVGAIAVRDHLNEELAVSGGHIGYGIRPSERRKGYGSKMLALALDKCREKGMEKVLITCDKDNLASARTAISNGGVLEDEITEESGNIIQRYWI